ncbi:transmembrane protein, putative [Medicago truncatula]|uniref:Transmembrane protein, putative n=1 Tax=Medicago truncatula TaxID=3880 RepID=A0A072VFM2_MEDTR|nr:transmembrane protein, putative [Medicago truncatula]
MNYPLSISCGVPVCLGCGLLFVVVMAVTGAVWMGASQSNFRAIISALRVAVVLFGAGLPFRFGRGKLVLPGGCYAYMRLPCNISLSASLRLARV